MGNFKLQSWKTKLVKWYKSSNKYELSGFYMEKNSRFTGSFSWGCLTHYSPVLLFDVFRGYRKATPDCDGLMRRSIHWCCFLSTCFFNHPFCGRPCCKTSIIYIIVDDPPASTLTSSLLSPLLPRPLVLVNSFPNSCVTDGCWFPPTSSFNMFTKSINDSTILFRAFSLFMTQ